MPLHVELVSPEQVVLSTDAEMVRARTVGGGDIAFLPGHTPFLGALDTWTLAVRTTDGRDLLAAVHGGFISVNDDQVRVLSDLAELSEEIDRPRAEAAKARAEADLAKGVDVEAEAALRRAHARLEAVGGLGT